MTPQHFASQRRETSDQFGLPKKIPFKLCDHITATSVYAQLERIVPRRTLQIAVGTAPTNIHFVMLQTVSFNGRSTARSAHIWHHAGVVLRIGRCFNDRGSDHSLATMACGRDTKQPQTQGKDRNTFFLLQRQTSISIRLRWQHVLSGTLPSCTSANPSNTFHQGELLCKFPS